MQLFGVLLFFICWPLETSKLHLSCLFGHFQQRLNDRTDRCSPIFGSLFKGQNTQMESNTIDYFPLWQMTVKLILFYSCSFYLCKLAAFNQCVIMPLVFTFVFLPPSSCVVTHVKGKSSLCSWHLFSVKLHCQVWYWGMSSLLKLQYRAFSWHRAFIGGHIGGKILQDMQMIRRWSSNQSILNMIYDSNIRHIALQLLIVVLDSTVINYITQNDLQI